MTTRLLAIAPTGFFADYGCHVRIMGQLLALQRLGYRVHLATYPAGRDVAQLHTVRPPVPLARAMPVGSSRRKLLLDALLAPTALAEAMRFRPDFIHSYLHEGALIGWALARVLRRPLTMDYQGSLTAEMLDHRFISPDSALLPALNRLERWIERRPAAIFPSSQHATTLLKSRNVPRQRLHPLPDSVDPLFFAPQPPDPELRRSLGLDATRPLVVYLGLLAPYQGTDLLLRAIAEPPLAQHAAQFLVMGFPYVESYQRLADRLKIAERVRFTGAIPYSQAPRYLALGQAAVAPKLSATEGSGKLFPYMSMVLPVVATDTPVHREYLGDSGMLVAPPTPAALAQALVEVLADLDTWRQRALLLRQRVCDRYTWDHAAATLHGVLRQL